LFTTIAYQLSATNPKLKEAILQAVTNYPDITQKGLREQWKNLILQPLSEMDEDPLQQEPVVLIIDALDECEDEDDVDLILNLFAEAKDLRSVPLRIFITSRPETTIMYRMDRISEAHQDFILHNISRPIVSSDISLFLRYELAKIKKRRHIRGEWPGEENIDTFIQRADGLFIYAATICRFLGEKDAIRTNASP
jgi:hypothetical protein